MDHTSCYSLTQCEALKALMRKNHCHLSIDDKFCMKTWPHSVNVSYAVLESAWLLDGSCTVVHNSMLD